MLKCFILFVILILSDNAFCQFLKPADLIGKWTFSTDTAISPTIQKWDFKNDTLLIITDSANPYTHLILSYVIYQSKDTTILKTHRYFKSGSSIYFFYSTNKITFDKYNLKILRSEDDRFAGEWETEKGHPWIFILKRTEYYKWG